MVKQNRHHLAAISRREVLAGAAALGLAGVVPAARAQAAPPKTIEPGVITIATTGDAPLAFLDNGKLVGMDGTVLSSICAQLNLKPKVVLMEWVATIEAVRTGRADMMIGNVGWTQKRTEVI